MRVGLGASMSLAGGAGRVSAAGQAAKAGTNTSGAGGLWPSEACGRTVLSCRLQLSMMI